MSVVLNYFLEAAQEAEEKGGDEMSILLGMARLYLTDLEAHQAGDAGRFSRMVDRGGNAMPGCNKEKWGAYVISALATCEGEPGYDEVAQRAARLGLWPAPKEEEER